MLIGLVLLVETMSDTIITYDKKDESGAHFIECTTGKATAQFWFFANSDRVQIVCKNAANRVWKGLGKCYTSTAAALENYKSADMRANILAAAELVKSAPANVVVGVFSENEKRV